MKRSLIVRFRDGETKEFPISKASKIKGDGIDMLHFDKLPNGTWRLTFTESITDDFSKIESFTIHREN